MSNAIDNYKIIREIDDDIKRKQEDIELLKAKRALIKTLYQHTYFKLTISPPKIESTRHRIAIGRITSNITQEDFILEKIADTHVSSGTRINTLMYMDYEVFLTGNNALLEREGPSTIEPITKEDIPLYLGFKYVNSPLVKEILNG